MRLEAEWLSLVTNIGSFAMIIILIKSAKEVLIHWLYLRNWQENDLLGPTELQYHGGRLKPRRPVQLITPLAPSVEDPTTQPQGVSTGWNGLVEKWLGAVHVRGTP
jgi:hypothetical protein